MKKLTLLAICLAVWTAAVAEEFRGWLEPARWKPLGTAPVTIGYDAGEQALRIAAEFGGVEKKLAYPLFALRPGERFPAAASIRFELKTETVSGLSGSVVLPKQEGTPNYFPFRIPDSAGWRTVEAKLAKGYDLEKARVIQIQLITNGEKLDVLIRGIEFLDAGGNVLPLLRTGGKSATLRGAGPADFFFSPGKPALLTLSADGFEEGKRLRWRLTDYSGRDTGDSGEATVSGGRIRLELPTANGFRELCFAEPEQRFGLVFSPPCSGPADDFWGVNSILGVKYLHHLAQGAPNDGFANAGELTGYLGLVRRCGIRQVREMAAFFRRAPEEGDYDFNRALAGDLCDFASGNDLRILTFYEHFPAWLGTTRGVAVPPEKAIRQMMFPEKLGGLYADMLRRESASASGVQVMNENDAPGKNAPPDNTVSLSWITRSILNRNGLRTPVVGMAFAGFAGHGVSDFLFGLYAENGFLDAIDVLAFNNYGSPEAFSDALERAFRLLSTFSANAFPDLWITECGKPWRRGTPRAEVAEDIRSASWIVRKAIEAKAFGVGRFYVFCLPFFEENSNNFGMFDAFHSPQRSFAAYAAAVALLSGKHYVGDLPVPGGEGARVFSDGRNPVAVLSLPAERFMTGGIPAKRWLAADGSVLAPAPDGTVPAAGGILYAELDPQDLPKLNTATDAMRSNRLMTNRKPPLHREYPVVFRLHAEEFRRGPSGYYPDRPEFPVRVTAYNLSAAPVETAPRLEEETDRRVAATPEKALIPPGGKAEFSWNVAMNGKRICKFRITEASGLAPAITPRFLHSTGSVPIPGTADAANWRADSGGAMTVENVPAEHAVKFTTRFNAGADCWAFPKYELKLPEESAAGMIGVSYEIRTEPEDMERGFVNSGIFFAADAAPVKYSTLVPGGPGVEWETRRILFHESPDAIRTLIPGVLNKPCRSSVFYLRNMRFF